MTTSGESESDDSEMGRLQGKDSSQIDKKPFSWNALLLFFVEINLDKLL